MEGTQKRDDEYFRRYSELHTLINNAFVDFYLLTSIDGYNITLNAKEYALPANSHHVLEHIGNLIISDFALILWKITDSSADSNTIDSFRTYIRTKHGKTVQVGLSKQSSHLRDNELREIRKHSLAHNDIQKTGITINRNSLFSLLEDVRKIFNASCFTDIDDRVIPYSDAEMLNVALVSSSGLSKLIDNSLVKLKHKAEKGDNDA